MKNLLTRILKYNAIQYCLVSFLLITPRLQAQDANLGVRADWMRGAWGALWLPESNFNGNIEGVRIDDFLTQIKGLKTIDYIQVGLTSPNIYSPVHTAPHSIIEGLWKGDMDSNGDPINLGVPRASVDDPFLTWLLAIKAAGLKTEVYVNSYNLLDRVPTSIPADFPDLSARWKNYCDKNTNTKAFIASKPYHKDGLHDDRRPYMFCYAEFILKEYAVRYGDLIDAWCFDSADNIMEAECGDNPDSGVLADQRIYEAFANAVHAGNPNAAVAFNNSVGVDGAPFATPTLFDDYAFGHPFGGAGDMVAGTLYARNYAICQLMGSTSGLPFRTDDRSWNNKVVGHFFPKLSTTSWNSGNTPCLTDAQFVQWNNTGVVNGGGITWGTPLVITNLNNNNPNLTLQPYALTQLTKSDVDLMKNQSPGAPNWARQRTILPKAVTGKSFSHKLSTGTDFWDPEGNTITELSAVSTDNVPSWLTITQTATGVWKLSGTPNETNAKTYTFRLRIKDASGGTNRWVTLNVTKSTTSKIGSDKNAIEEDTADAVVLYPNPVTNYISLNVAIQSANIIDLKGKVVKTNITETDSLDVSDLQSGTYILKGITRDGKSVVKKFIKN